VGKTYEKVDGELADWIARQPVFFVATAPLAADGLLNCSPKGLDTLRVIDARTVAYLDLTGSGIETVAHLRENGRIVLLLCAFEGRPRIVRLHGNGEVLMPCQPGFEELRPRFPELPGVRSIVRVSLTRIADSCGFGVPLMRYEGARDQLIRAAGSKSDAELKRYRAAKNARSIDGLPGLPG
jgi:hypothetical protein